MPRVMEIATPLGDDVLLFHGMHGREELGRLFEYQLDLLSLKEDVNLDDILGQSVTIRLTRVDDSIRYFNGYVTRFAQSGKFGRYHRYAATVRPWLWFLTRTSDCRIFQELTVPEIVKSVFGDHPTADFKLELTSTYRKWNYCVQYRETDFNFISRLLEQEGIYYYFRHTDGHDTMVLTDSTSKHTPAPGCETLPYVAAGQLVTPGLERVSSWDFAREIEPGIYVHDDYDLDRPGVELRTSRVLPRSYSASDYEVYDYPGQYLQRPDGEQYALIRIDELGSQFETASAASNARGITVGSLFNLAKHPRADQNREYLVLAASHDLEFNDYESLPDGGRTDYRCTFAAMSTRQQFRPRRLTPKPFVQGPQTATVVGPAGDEIFTDALGRVKVQFHWDRYGQHNEHSSCWIRVSQTWAGKGWGAVSTPRIRHEVIVDFLEGDPDQPIILGSVHNGDNPPPHVGVVSGLKSNTHKGFGSNEMVLDDTAGKERVDIHAQHDMHTVVENDQSVTVVGGNRTMTIQAGTLTDTVKGNASLTVQAGSRTVGVTGGDYAATASAAILLHGKGQGVGITGDAKGVGITGNGEGVVIVGNGQGVGITGNGDGVGIVGNATGVYIEGNGQGVGIKGTPDFFAEGTATAGIKSPDVDIGNGTITIHGSSILLTTDGGSIEIGAAGVTITSGCINVSGGTVNVAGSLVTIN